MILVNCANEIRIAGRDGIYASYFINFPVTYISAINVNIVNPVFDQKTVVLGLISEQIYGH